MNTLNPRALRRTAAALLIATTTALTTACGVDVPDETPKPLTTDGVVIVTNSRANVPRPQLSPANASLISDVLRAGLPVTVVSADGTPELVPLPTLRVTGNNGPAVEKSLTQALQTVQLAITALPNSGGVSSYGAVSVARDSALALDMRKPTIICLMCGLETAGPLAMTGENALRAEARDFVEHLESTQQLVRFDGFDSATVVLTSVGATAAPQQPLSPRDRENLVAIWRSSLEAGSAVVVIDPQPASGESISTEFSVPVIEPTPETAITFSVCEPQSIAFDGASSARFVAESDRWIDTDAAREALRPLADWLRESPRRTASVQGTTADIRSGRPDEGKGLSLRRATAARDLLVELGVDPDQIIKVEGLGPHYPGKIDDRDAAGNPIPALRVKNRKVIVTLADDC